MGALDDNQYARQSKKVFLFTMIAETILLVIIHAYSLCVVSTYGELMHGKGAYADEEKKPKAWS